MSRAMYLSLKEYAKAHSDKVGYEVKFTTILSSILLGDCAPIPNEIYSRVKDELSNYIEEDSNENDMNFEPVGGIHLF